MFDAFRFLRGLARRWPGTRLVLPSPRPQRLRAGEVSDEEVIRAIRTVPTHWSGWSFVQGAVRATGDGNSSSARTVTLTGVTVGNLLVGIFGSHIGGGGVTIAGYGDGSNTWHAAVNQYSSGTDSRDQISLLYATATTGGSLILSVPPSISCFAGLIFMEYSCSTGVPASPLDSTSTNDGTSGVAPSTGSCAVNNAGSLVIGAVAQTGSTTDDTLTPDAGFNLREHQGNANNDTAVYGLDVLNTGSAQNFTGTFAVAQVWVAAAASFKAGTVAAFPGGDDDALVYQTVEVW